MADGTKIEWTDATWNPITGCSVVSPGCTNCYAMKLAGTRLKHHPTRKGLTTDSKAGPVWNGQVRFNEGMLLDPLKWRRPRMIFVCAHGDLFAEGVPDKWIDKVFAVMALSPQHTFQVLTKRPERMQAYLLGLNCDGARRFNISNDAERIATGLRPWKGDGATDWDATVARAITGPDWPLPNVWLGVSVEDQKRADERISVLVNTPAAVRWISAEPLLGAVDVSRWTASANVTCKVCKRPFWLHDAEPCQHAEQGGWTLACPSCGGCRCKPGWTEMDARCGAPMEPPQDWVDSKVGRFGKVHPRIALTSMIDWVVAGGESGHSARPMHPDWARSLRDQCAAAGVPFLFKQWGEYLPAIDRERDDPDWRRDYSHTYADDQPDMAWLNIDGGCGFHGARFHVMQRVGKRVAGRLLDGVEHNAFPTAPQREEA